MLLLCTWSQNRGWSDGRSRRTYGKGLVFVCLCRDEWPVSARWLVCTIKLSKRKDFSLIVPFREELWNSELFATAMELAGLRRGQGEGQTEFSSLRPVWHSSQRETDAETNVGLFPEIRRLISLLSLKMDNQAMTLQSSSWVRRSCQSRDSQIAANTS